MSKSANGSAVEYYFVVEDAGGAIPSAPAFKPIRYNTSTLARNTAQVDSNEINPDRQRPLSRQGTYSTQGDIVAELSDDSFDDLLEIAMQSTWSANSIKIGSTERSFAILERHTDITNATITATTISAAAADSSFNDSASGFVTAGFAVGDLITTSGFTDPANNGVFKIATVAAGKITVTDVDDGAVTLVVEAAGNSVTIAAKVDFIYRGCRLNTVACAAQIDAAPILTFGVIGTAAEPYAPPDDATYATASTSDMMVTSQGSLTENGKSLGYATAFDFTLDNGMSPTFALFQRAAYDVSNGVATVGGTMSAYLEDGRLYGKFLDETETDFAVQFSDGTNTRTFTFPKVLMVQASKGVQGPGALIPQYTFSAGYDSGAATTLTITRSA
jgi:hypothetical protein